MQQVKDKETFSRVEEDAAENDGFWGRHAGSNGVVKSSFCPLQIDVLSSPQLQLRENRDVSNVKYMKHKRNVEKIPQRSPSLSL
jgi:hypothetical protein